MFIYTKVDQSKFFEMYEDASDWYFINTRHLVKIEIFLSNCLHVDGTAVVLFHCCNLIWSLRNTNYSFYLLQILTVNIRVDYFYMKMRQSVLAFPYLLKKFVRYSESTLGNPPMNIFGWLSKFLLGLCVCWNDWKLFHKRKLLRIYIWSPKETTLKLFWFHHNGS